MGDVVGAVDFADAGGAGFAGVAVVEAVDVGEQDEEVGADEVGDEGGEAVVVAEADLVGGDGVVLVDDGEGAHGQELVEGAVGVAVVGAAAGVVAGEEDLSDAYAVAGEGGGVAGDEEALADAGGGLLAGEVGGAAAQAEGASPAAMAPEETSTISFSPARRPPPPSTEGLRPAVKFPLRALARTSTRASTRSASRPPEAVVREDEPTLTTILRAWVTYCLATVTPGNLCQAGGWAHGRFERWTGRGMAPAGVGGGRHRFRGLSRAGGAAASLPRRR